MLFGSPRFGTSSSLPYSGVTANIIQLVYFAFSFVNDDINIYTDLTKLFLNVVVIDIEDLLLNEFLDKDEFFVKGVEWLAKKMISPIPVQILCPLLTVA